ncbi:MAG: plasmid pRiA4b ORF-3 family protein, partial [Tissierellia bacterium]|nr:plasmid pRiA4b ORF-3 family protein [Tissierellia bacterium]
MGEVYKFNVKLIGLEEIMWRDIEISSLSTLAKLSYAVLAAFDCKGTHLFNINLREQRYEIIFGDEDDYFNQLPIDPRGIKLEKIKLEIGETLLLEYNYGASW